LPLLGPEGDDQAADDEHFERHADAGRPQAIGLHDQFAELGQVKEAALNSSMIPVRAIVLLRGQMARTHYA
jgi:hypothetical protein